MCIFMPVHSERMRDTANARTFSLKTSQRFSVSLGQPIKLRELREVARTRYCGFCVIRPLPKAPIGRTVLQAEVRGRKGMESTVTCRAQFGASLLGVDFEVTRYPRISSRMLASALVPRSLSGPGMRHMHARYGYNWVSVAGHHALGHPDGPGRSQISTRRIGLSHLRTHDPGHQRGGLSAPLFRPPEHCPAPSCRT